MIVYCTQEALPLVSKCKMGNRALVQGSCSTETDEQVQSKGKKGFLHMSGALNQREADWPKQSLYSLLFGS